MESSPPPADDTKIREAEREVEEAHEAYRAKKQRLDELRGTDVATLLRETRVVQKQYYDAMMDKFEQREGWLRAHGEYILHIDCAECDWDPFVFAHSKFVREMEKRGFRVAHSSYRRNIAEWRNLPIEWRIRRREGSAMMFMHNEITIRVPGKEDGGKDYCIIM